MKILLKENKERENIRLSLRKVKAESTEPKNTVAWGWEDSSKS